MLYPFRLKRTQVYYSYILSSHTMINRFDIKYAAETSGGIILVHTTLKKNHKFYRIRYGISII